MAHAARIEDGIVREVIVVPNDLDETESDAAIEAYIHGIGLTGTWIRTSYNKQHSWPVRRHRVHLRRRS